MRAIFCYNYSKFFISHRLPLLKKIKLNFSEIVFLGNVLNQESLFLKKNVDFAFDTKISKGSLNIFKLIKYILIFPYKRLRKRNYFHLIEIATLKGLLIALPIIYRNQDAKIVFWICGLGTIFLSNKFHHKIIRFFLIKIYAYIYKNFNTSWIFENHDDKNFFQKNLSLHEKDLTVIPGSGYELKKQKSNKKIKKNKIVFIGRLIKDKGIIEYIDAIKNLLSISKNMSWKFEIIGDFDDNPTSIKKHELDRLIGKYPIRFAGFVNDMNKYYEEVFCVVLPSYREGLSRVLIEAGAHSIPSVTTNVTGCRDIIKNNVNGLLISPKSVKELTNAIQFLINNPDISKDMGTNAYNIFKEKYSIETISTMTLNFYKR